MSLREFVSEFDGDDADNAVIAEKVLDRLLGLRKADLREALRPVIVNAVTDLRRDSARHVERRITAPRDDAEEYDPTDDRRRFLSENVYCGPERGYVAKGDATREDHLARAEYLRTQAAGFVRTAEMHERAAAILLRKKARCLNDLGDAFDPKELES